MSEKVREEPGDDEAEDLDSGEPTSPGTAFDSETAGDDAGDIAIEVDTSDIDADQITALQARIEALEQEKKDTFDRLLRATADLDNQRKRARRDVDDARVEAKSAVLTHMLPVVDNLERALEHAEKADQASAESIVEGVKLVLRQFVQAFERSDVASFDAVGQSFDPNLHEAVGQIETDDHPPGAVAQELQRGYKIGERLLRPAMVVVARAPAEPEPAEAAPNGHDKGADTDVESEGESGEGDG